jgi:general secretion pathway protein G
MGLLSWNNQLVAAVGLAALATIGYLVSRAKCGRKDFTLLDTLILAVAIAILAGTGVPLLEAARHQTQLTVLQENLHTLRSQIELYQLQHQGVAPRVEHGTLPQLLQPTNAAGAIGSYGTKYPFGPYLTSGVPTNPLTGRSIVSLTESFPPQAPSDGGGWLYHQATGQIAADVAGYLGQ